MGSLAARLDYYLKQNASSISIPFETLNPDIINLLLYTNIRGNKNTEFPSAQLSAIDQ